MIIPSGWRVELETVGYLGKRREEKFAEWNERHGEWMFGWKTGNGILDFDGVCQMYEDAYFLFLKDNIGVLLDLIHDASDVYDDEESNVLSGFDYRKQETGRTHLQDIAIRRCVVRFGVRFGGDRLIRIRQELGDQPYSMLLSPGKVPFHWPNIIKRPQLEGWWDPNSVESFYQSNRVLLVREKIFGMDVVIDPALGPDEFRLGEI